MLRNRNHHDIIVGVIAFTCHALQVDSTDNVFIFSFHLKLELRHVFFYIVLPPGSTVELQPINIILTQFESLK